MITLVALFQHPAPAISAEHSNSNDMYSKEGDEEEEEEVPQVRSLRAADSFDLNARRLRPRPTPSTSSKTK